MVSTAAAAHPSKPLKSFLFGFGCPVAWEAVYMTDSRVLYFHPWFGLLPLA